jgi:hypothetical protein
MIIRRGYGGGTKGLHYLPCYLAVWQHQLVVVEPSSQLRELECASHCEHSNGHELHEKGHGSSDRTGGSWSWMMAKGTGLAGRNRLARVWCQAHYYARGLHICGDTRDNPGIGRGQE